WADAAFRCLQGLRLEKFTGPINLPSSPRCYSSCWLEVIYNLAGEDGASPLLRTRMRTVGGSDSWLESSESRYVTFTVLEQDVFTASGEVAEVILQRIDENEHRPPARGLRLRIVDQAVFLDDRLVPLDLTPEAAEEAVQYLRALIDHAPGWVTGPEI